MSEEDATEEWGQRAFAGIGLLTMRRRDGDNARLLASVLVICLASPASLAQDTEAVVESGSASAQRLLAWRNRQKLSDIVGAECCQIEVHAPSSEGYYSYEHVNALQVPPDVLVSSSLVCTARDDLADCVPLG